ncbi:CMGC/CDK/CDC2 protein kinase [Edhazardia aedis USNM 41457]|uniref:Cyclin-dependent kinase 1 n=1 Tax=Edhazardia aedis (strain USNM 41457) TaxID=1003232 RepID=J9DNB6_EDHAE|nr:CMGC/CDK/CDC2 protein kinase [Edhazardia aedis USNM 41457]|eukprot:EJW04030.1 CMGC/CDK/CDC2 protein kinase [Edhazardia aedis USNM 41457]
MVEEYEKIAKLGEGTYGIVYKVRCKKTGNIFALKKIRLDDEQEGIPSTTIREISLLKTLKHSTIINLMKVSYSQDKLFLIFDFIETDLRKLLDDLNYQQKTLPENIVKKISQQILTAVNFCHSKGVLHRDIKPQNILIDKDFNIKLADFGLGRCISIPLRTYTKEIVTLWYRAPELLLGCKYYAWSVDIWSVGCIFYEIITGEPLFSGDSEIDQLFKIFRIKGTPTEDDWPNVTLLPNFQTNFQFIGKDNLIDILPKDDIFSDLILKLLVYNPIERLTAKNALKHMFFYNMPPIDE